MVVPFLPRAGLAPRLPGALTIALLLLFSASFATQAQVDTNAFLWAQGGGGPLNDKASGVAVDIETNVIVAGDFSGVATIAGATLQSAGSSDIFVCKYTPLGQPIWRKRFGGALDDSATGVASDTHGNIYVSGYYRGAVDFGGKPLLAHGGSTLDGFVAKLDPDGAVVWANSIGGSGDDRCYKVAVDSQGNVYGVGTFQATIAFGPGVSLTSTNTQVPEAFLVRYTPAGGALWARRVGASQGAAGYGVAIGPDGNPGVAGEFVGAGVVEGVPLPNSGDRDVFLVKFSAAGDRMWANRYGADGADGARALTADAAGNLVVGGYFSGIVDFGGGPLAAKARKDFFILRTGPDGVFQWARSGGGLQDDLVTSVSTTVAGSVYAVGTFAGILTMGGADLVSAGSGNDAFLLRLDPDGALRSVSRAGGSGLAFDSANAVATGPQGITFFAGEFSGLGLFGTNSLNTGSVTNRDYFVARRASVPPDIQALSADVLAVLGEPFQLEVKPSGEGPFFYQWERNGTPVLGETNAMLVRVQSEVADNGDFAVVVSNGEGSVRSPAVGVHLFVKLIVTAQGRGQAIADPVLANYALGSRVVLLALPDADAFFSGWSGDLGGNVNPASLTMDSHRAVTAVFGSRRLDLGVVGEGRVQPLPSQELYNPGDLVALTATPAKFFEFLGWSDGELGATRQVTIGVSNHFVAVFTNLVPVETLVFGGVSRTAPIGTPALFVDGQFVTQGPITRGDVAELKLT
ncbi:MAG: SBBP repeat-containing protein, partial [Verrucomicrobia bacterium]|nr:SBBP repeat-containing protein [Verrucomicrobiota bacterium]